MKTRHVFLIGSLVANGALAVLLWRGMAAGGTGSPSRPELQRESPSKSPIVHQAPARPESASPLQAADPHIALRDRLSALGFSRDVVNAVVRGVIEEPRRARERALYAELAKAPWWHSRQSFTSAEDRELRALMRTEREEILRVLGPGGYAADEQLERYSYLDPEKAAKLVALQRDYAELRREAADDTKAGRTEMAERLKLLAAEHDRDIAALLTPEERARFDARESSSARTLGYRFEFFDATEAEYGAVLTAQRTFDEKMAGLSPSSANPDASRARGEAMRQMGDDVLKALGAERYAQFIQAQRPEYRALVELQRRYDVPAAAFQQAARVHLDISTEVTRIAEDSTLGGEQKQAQLAALAPRATAGIRAALGPALAETYLAATRASWIDVLGRGSAYTASANGSTGTRTFGPPRPAIAPKT